MILIFEGIGRTIPSRMLSVDLDGITGRSNRSAR